MKGTLLILSFILLSSCATSHSIDYSKYEVYTLIISLLAIVVSYCALVQSYKTSKKQLEQDKKLSDLAEKQLSQIIAEEQKTTIKVYVNKMFSDSKLIILNNGSSPAFDVELKIISRELKGSPLNDDDYKSKFPIKCLDPGDEVSLFWSISTVTGTTFDSICSWKNLDGTQGKKETII